VDYIDGRLLKLTEMKRSAEHFCQYMASTKTDSHTLHLYNHLNKIYRNILAISVQWYITPHTLGRFLVGAPWRSWAANGLITTLNEICAI
jgi:hypothetical protein